MKKSLFLFLFIFISASSFSQIFWDRRPTGFASSRGVLDVSIADANNIWIQVYDGTTPSNAILEFGRSTDGGNTWTPGTFGIGVTAPTTTTICSLRAIDGNTCFVGSSDDGLFKTTDGGVTWTKKTVGLFTGSTSFFDFGSFVDANVGVVVGDPEGGYMEVYRTTDGGNTWNRISSSSFSLPIITGEYAFTNSYTQKGNAIYFFTNKARTYRSLDAGLTWSVFANPFTATSNDTTPGGEMCLKSETEGIYYNSTDYTYWKTTDGGATFTDMVPVGTLRANDLTFVPGTADTYISIGDDVDLTLRGTSYSCDGGTTWEDINPLGDTINVNGGSKVEFFSTTLGFASGFNTSSTVGGIFKYVGPAMGSATSVCPVLATSNFTTEKFFNVSPNPTSGKFSLNGVNISQVQVTDVLGKVIFNNTYSSMSNVELNISDYNAGIYFVKATNDLGNSSIVKVIKE